MLVMLWIAQRFSVDDYASWGLLYSFQIGVTLMGAVGIVESIIALRRSTNTEIDRIKHFAAGNDVCSLNLIVAGVVAAALYLGAAGDSGSEMLTAAWVLISAALLAIASLQAQYVRLEERHTASLYFNFVTPLAGLAGSVVGVLFERTANAYFMGSTVGLALALFGARFAGMGYFSTARARSDMLPILRRIWPFISVAFLGWLSGYGNNYIVEIWFDTSEVAKFTLAFMLVSVMQLVATAMNQVWSPRFYRLIHESPVDQVERQNRRFANWQALALGATGALLILLFPVVARILGGNLAAYGSLRMELLMLVTGYILIVPFWQCQNYLLVHDKGPAMMNIHVVSSVFGIAVLIFLLFAAGPFGVYIGFMVQMALRSTSAVVVARKRWPIEVSWMGVTAGIAMAGAAALLG